MRLKGTLAAFGIAGTSVLSGCSHEESCAQKGTSTPADNT
jgi:hypothetical protein